MRRKSSWMLSAATALLLVACGGGGDSASGPYAVNAALKHLLVAGGSWTMNGSASGQSFTLTLAFAPAPAGLFPPNGVWSAQSVQTLTVAAAGQSNTGTITVYFDPQLPVFFGIQADGACSVATANTALPTSATVGASGAFFTESDLDGCAGNSAAVGTTASTWSLVADSGVVLLCWNLTSKDLAGTVNGTESTCIETAADGTLGTHARFALNSGGVTLSARNF
jgi:hypothetical protein